MNALLLFFFSNFLFVSVEHRSCKQSAIFFFLLILTKKKKRKTSFNRQWKGKSTLLKWDWTFTRWVWSSESCSDDDCYSSTPVDFEATCLGSASLWPKSFVMSRRMVPNGILIAPYYMTCPLCKYHWTQRKPSEWLLSIYSVWLSLCLHLSLNNETVRVGVYL